MNPTVKQTDILGDEQVVAIAKLPATSAGNVLMSASERDALLRDRAALQAQLNAVEQERREGLSLDKVAAVAVEAFRRQAIAAVLLISVLDRTGARVQKEAVTLLETLEVK